MKKQFYLMLLSTLMSFQAFAQSITQPPNGDNQKSSVTQMIGLVKVTIDYSSPDVHGPNGEDRTGKIWGEVVHYGFIDQGFGTSKAAPYRAGANENTTITFSHDVQIEGKDLKAGTYGLFLALAKEGSSQWIFSRNNSSWGSYFYDEKDDALRVSATLQPAPYTEWLSFHFEDRQPSSTVAYLQWENKRIGFKVSVPNIHQLYVDKMRDELKNSTGFDHRNWVFAAQYCVANNINLDEALNWADYGISGAFIGEENFLTVSTKALVLRALKRNTEANALMDQAIKLPTATADDIYQYGRSLITEGKNAEALTVFKYNQQRFPKSTFVTTLGLARGYAATGDKKNAIKNWELVLKNIPDNRKQFKTQYEEELRKLKG
jgi:tetratricopeptide (TPR) repeat protein